MPAEYGEKTEAPTPRRRHEARERGQVARSQELSSTLLLFGGLLALRFLAPVLTDALAALFHVAVTDWDDPVALRDPIRPNAPVLWALGLAVAPLFLVMTALAAGVHLIQVGPLFSWHPLRPSWARLNPAAGVARLFSLRSGVHLVISLLKLALVTGVACIVIRNDLPRIVAAVDLDDRQILPLAAHLAFWLGIRLAALLLFLAVLDYAFQRWQQERDLRMTKEEVREELRRMEGDPVLKHRRRQIQLQIAAQRLRRDVPKADVVVTNPTELAVALRYEEATMRAPVVVAKGAGVLAQRIRELAVEHGIPIVERKPLAQALYRTVEVGDEIPASLYRAVAEILAHVYQISRPRRPLRRSA